MFVQVIKGKTQEPQELRARFEEWKAQLAGSADGWLSSTAGVSDDGTFVAMVQFESQEAARRNSERPEQGEWWSKTEPLIADASFVDSEEVLTMLDGPSEKAGFVQIIEERANDLEAARSLWAQAQDYLPQARPEVLGGLVAVHGNLLTQAMYFTDEAAARAGESRTPSPEDQALMDQMSAAFGEASYLDLREPWHMRP